MTLQDIAHGSFIAQRNREQQAVADVLARLRINECILDHEHMFAHISWDDCPECGIRREDWLRQ